MSAAQKIYDHVAGPKTGVDGARIARLLGQIQRDAARIAREDPGEVPRAIRNQATVIAMTAGVVLEDMRAAGVLTEDEFAGGKSVH